MHDIEFEQALRLFKDEKKDKVRTRSEDGV